MNKYTVAFEPIATGYSAHVPALPGCVAAAATLEETRQLMRGDRVPYRRHTHARRGCSLNRLRISSRSTSELDGVSAAVPIPGHVTIYRCLGPSLYDGDLKYYSGLRASQPRPALAR